MNTTNMAITHVPEGDHLRAGCKHPTTVPPLRTLPGEPPSVMDEWLELNADFPDPDEFMEFVRRIKDNVPQVQHMISEIYRQCRQDTLVCPDRP